MNSITKLAKQTAFPCSPPSEAFALEIMAKAIYERENRDPLNNSFPWKEAHGVEQRKAKQCEGCLQGTP